MTTVVDVIAACAGEEATIVGTPGDGRLLGTNGDDVIVGLGGDDDIDGRGDDFLDGGPGDPDVCDGDTGRNTITDTCELDQVSQRSAR